MILKNISITRKILILALLSVFEILLFLTYFIIDDNHDNDNSYIYITAICGAFLSTTVLSYDLVKSVKFMIQNLNSKIDEKTTELKILNQKLEEKIKKEVEKNREKDKIMFQHARLASMGEMVGNIAHQWRQPLNAMSVLIQSFAIKNMAGKLTDEFIDKQVEEGIRLSNMMSQTIEDFRNFFTPNKSREYFNLKNSIKDTIDLSQEHDVNITIKSNDNIMIYGYENEFSQVILNLLNNSIDSFKKIDHPFDKNILIQVSEKDNEIMLSFIDNGGGIKDDIIDRIFEPYFTTKHKSTGTGIGLYMSKQIIEKQMKGTIEVENIMMNFEHQTLKCAKFDITLPSVQHNLKLEDKKLSIA